MLSTQMVENKKKESVERMMLKKCAIALSVLLLVTLVACSNSRDEENSNSSTSDDSPDSIDMNGSDDSVGFSDPTDNNNNYGRGALSGGADTNAEAEPVRVLTENASSIIIYFSRSGNTENLAQQIESLTGADVLELQVKDPYPSDYEETVDRADEERESGNFPELVTQIPDLSQYDTIFLGHPIWSMTIANPIARFLEDNSEELSGKSIAVFSTNAGYGAGSSIDRVSELSPNSTILENYTIEDEKVVETQDGVKSWLQRLGALKK
jgi:flavodoxin